MNEKQKSNNRQQYRDLEQLLSLRISKKFK